MEGDTLTFTLTQPRNLSIEVNGEIFDNLQLFANPLETDRPDPRDPDVIYFGPGVHELTMDSRGSAPAAARPPAESPGAARPALV